MRKAYQTDLSDAEWGCLEPLLPAPKATGCPRIHPLREVLDAMSLTPSSTSSRAAVPGDSCHTTSLLGKRFTTSFRFWRLDGTWKRMHSALCKRVRVRLKRIPLSPARP